LDDHLDKPIFDDVTYVNAEEAHGRPPVYDACWLLKGGRRIYFEYERTFLWITIRDENKARLYDHD